jgi:Cro/C1-type HTH DNA-binding domain
MKDYLDRIAHNLKLKMNDKSSKPGPTFDSIAKGINTHRSTPWRLSKGQLKNPKLSTLIKISEHLKMDITELLAKIPQTEQSSAHIVQPTLSPNRPNPSAK